MASVGLFFANLSFAWIAIEHIKHTIYGIFKYHFLNYNEVFYQLKPFQSSFFSHRQLYFVDSKLMLIHQLALFLFYFLFIN